MYVCIYIYKIYMYHGNEKIRILKARQYLSIKRLRNQSPPIVTVLSSKYSSIA